MRIENFLKKKSEQETKIKSNEVVDEVVEEYPYTELTGLPNSFFKTNLQNYLNNIKQRITTLESDSILVLKGGRNYPRYDADINFYYFYQEGNFYYLTGVSEPGVDAILDLKDGSLHLFYENPDPEDAIWMHIVTTEDLKKKYEVDCLERKTFYDFIKTRNPVKIFRLEGNNENSNLPLDYFEFDFSKNEELKAKLANEPLLYEVLKDTRAIKTKDEIDLLREIHRITMEGHKLLMKTIKSGLTERYLENVFNGYFLEKHYLRHWAYPNISGSGVNSATLHYDINNRTMKDGEIYLADMGIRMLNYTSDVTITIPVNGKFTENQKNIYELVLKANRDSMALIKPSVSFLQVEETAFMTILKGLQELNIINQGFTLQELTQNLIHKIFMPHGLGHFVGIDVHDLGRNIPYKPGRILEAGHFVTVEPGIYFVKFLLEEAFNDPKKAKYLNEKLIREQFMDFGGVRIEDDVLVTQDGYDNFTAKLPRTVQEIEEFMKKN